MRYNTATIIALGLVLIASPAAWAGTSNDEIEIHDPEGDAGPGGAPLGPATANLDIRHVDFVTGEDTTTAAMELAAFDVRPHETVYGIAYELDGESFVWFGYGKMIFPFPPFEVEGYYGCHVTEDDESCQELDGRETTEAPGFEVTIPRAWAPAGATLEDPMAAVFHDPMLPHPAGQVWWETVWPHNTEDMAGPGEDHVVDDGTSTDDADAAPTSTPATTTTSDEASSQAEDSDAPVGTQEAVGAAGLGVLALAGLAVRRMR